MKTLCNHCNQEYDVDESYLKKEVQCTVCNKNFFVNKAKFCEECGTINQAQAFICKKCGEDFPDKDTYVEKNVTTNYAPTKPPITPKEQKKERVKYDSNIWGGIAIMLSLSTIFIQILILPAIVFALFVHASKTQRYIALGIVVLRMAFNAFMEWGKLS